MHDLAGALLAPLAVLLLLFAGLRWPLAGLPRWSTLAYLLPFALACGFVFPSLDDWSYGASGRHGWWEAQGTWYDGWSGRVTATAVISGWGNLGSPWFAAVIGYRAVIAVLFAGMCWALWDLVGALIPEADRQQRATLSLVIAAGWISLLTDIAEGLYWLSGVASYGLGTLLMLVACSSMLRGVDGPRWRWWLALAALAIGCLSGEVVAALALTAVAGVVLVHLRGHDRWRGGAVLAGGLLATAILLLAPGNAVRALVALNDGQPAVDHAPLAVAGSTVRLLWRFIADAPWGPLLGLGAWIAWHAPARTPAAGARILLLAPLFILVAALPMAWAGMSPGRAWNPLAMCCSLIVVIAAWRGGPRLAVPLLLAAAVAVGSAIPPGSDVHLVHLGAWAAALGAAWLLRHRLGRGTLVAACAGALLLGSERLTSALVDLARGPRYAAEQQLRLARFAETAPGSAVEVPRLSGDLPYLYHTDDLSFSTQAWRNQGCAQFFGLASVRTR